MLSEDLGIALEYEWTSQARGSLDVALESHVCDVILGARWAADTPGMSAPYYRSQWVFVTRADRDLNLRSIPELKGLPLRIGVRRPKGAASVSAASSDDLVSRLRDATNVRSFARYRASPWPSGARTLIDAVTFGDIDVAIAWGPAAGYFAARSRAPLRLQPVLETKGTSPLTGEIAMRVRAEDTTLLKDIDRFLERRAAEIRQLLLDYRVPLLEPTDPDKPV